MNEKDTAYVRAIGQLEIIRDQPDARGGKGLWRSYSVQGPGPVGPARSLAACASSTGPSASMAATA